jgi:hypothetical protein
MHPTRFLRSLAAVTVAVALAGNVPAATAAVAPTPGARLTGADISWPNCPKGMGIPSRRTEGKPMPLDSAAFVIVGLTNGPGFHPNPCLADQVAWVKAQHRWLGAYSMTTYPDRATLRTYGGDGPWTPGVHDRARLRNAGYRQALFNVDSMRSAGVDVPFVWVDVEPYPTHPWSRSKRGNRAVITGVVRGYEESGYRVGFYSYLGGWLNVVGGWRKPRYPTWYPVGAERHGYTMASRRCSMPSFSGGPVMIGQWVEGDRDRNVTCPRLTGRGEGLHPLTRHLGTRLRVGSRGTAVRALQRALGVSADGVFGRRTKARLRSVQLSSGLVPTGVTGDDTWRALGAGTVLPERPSRLAEFFTPY